MPTLPRLTGPRVSPSPYPGVRVGVNAPEGDLSRGPFQAARGLAGDVQEMAGREIQAIQGFEKQERDKAHQIASAEFASNLSAEETRLKSKLQGVRGKEALQASTDTLKEFDKIYEERTRKVTDPDLRERFRGHYLQYRDSLNRSAIPYAEAQNRAYDNETSESLIQNETVAGIGAWNDPERVNLAAMRIYGTIEALAARNGKSREWAEAQWGQAVSGLYSGVVNGMLSAGQTREAKDFFDKHVDAFQDPEPIKRALEKDTLLGDVQSAVDSAMTTRQDLDGALERINEIAKGKDPKFREMARDLAKERFNDLAVAEDRRQKAVYESITKRHDADPSQDPRRIDPVGWETLNTARRDAITNRYAKATKEPTAADRQLFLKTLTMPEDELGAMDSVDFDVKIWSRLPKEFRDEAQTRYIKAFDALRKPEKRVEFQSIISDEQTMFKAAQEFGIGGITKDDTMESIGKTGLQNDKKQKALLEWRETLNTAMAAQHAITGKNPTDQQRRDLIYSIVESKYVGEADKMTHRIPTAEEYEKTLSVAYDAIAPADRSTIEAYIQKNGGAVTQDKVQRMYLAYKMGNRKRIDAILKE